MIDRIVIQPKDTNRSTTILRIRRRRKTASHVATVSLNNINTGINRLLNRNHLYYHLRLKVREWGRHLTQLE